MQTPRIPFAVSTLLLFAVSAFSLRAQGATIFRRDLPTPADMQAFATELMTDLLNGGRDETAATIVHDNLKTRKSPHAFAKWDGKP